MTNKLEAILGRDIVEVRPVSGGDINEARLIVTQDGLQFFVKLNDSANGSRMLETEALGLGLLQQAMAIGGMLVPEVLASGSAGTTAFLLLEYLPAATPSHGFWEKFGADLAKLHQHSADSFGLDHDNFIGRLAQSNDYGSNWPDFYASQRLLPQARLAYQQEFFDLKDMQQLERLCRQLPELYPSEPPALIHGDLWNGNFLVHSQARAILIDPAVSYSHREMDLAMTRLFGGFPAAFYAAYQQTYPLAGDWESRLPLGQLYYLLVHLNMFGPGYLPAVKRIMKGF